MNGVKDCTQHLSVLRSLSRANHPRFNQTMLGTDPWKSR